MVFTFIFFFFKNFFKFSAFVAKKQEFFLPTKKKK